VAETIFVHFLIKGRAWTARVVIRIRWELLLARTYIFTVLAEIVRHKREDLNYPVYVRIKYIPFCLCDLLYTLAVLCVFVIHSCTLYPHCQKKSTFIDIILILATLRSMTPFRFLDHTADLGIEVSESSLIDLFVLIGNVIFDTQVKGSREETRSITIECTSDSLEDLLVDWCRELLYNFSIHGFIPKTYILTINGLSLIARLRGDTFDKARHSVKTEIKNVTYHDLTLKKTDTGYRATVVFDV
jgi:SHS2 domain-containing protein